MTKKVVGVIIILIIAAIYKISSVNGTVKVKGVVTDIITHRMGRGTDVFPNVVFTYNGILYEIPHNEGSKFFNLYNVGDSASIYFPEGQPKAAQLYGLTDYYFTFPTIAIVGVLCIFWVGICIIIDQPGLSVDEGE